jgi:hypothetical protein
MKLLRITKRSYYLTLAAVGLWLAGAVPSHAHINFGLTPDQTGITYEFKGSTNHGGAGSISGSVGAKSWAEPNNPVDAKGWTHTSNWVQLDLSGMHVPGVLTIQMERGATGSLFPAFSLYSGWENDTPDTNNHTFNNTGAISWADDLTYIGHVANAGGQNGTANGTGLTSVSQQFFLNPGLYSIALGGNPAFSLGQTGIHAFNATFDVAAVPVPAAVWLFGSGLAGLVGLARRRMTA